MLDNFMEKGKWIAFQEMSSTCLFHVLFFLTRKYLLSIGLSPFEHFWIPIEKTLEVLEAAAYLEIHELQHICIDQITANYHGIVYS